MSTTHDMSYFHFQASTYEPYLNILLDWIFSSFASLLVH